MSDSSTDHPAFPIYGAVAGVTGGAGGIGRALVKELVGAGARVAVVDLAEDAAAAAAEEVGGAVGIGADVGDEAQVSAMVRRVQEELGPIDIYCSNAGVISGYGLGDNAAWDIAWKVHVLAHVYAARAVLPGMAERGSGAMVVTASAAGLLMMMGSAPYSVTKHGSVAIA